MMRKVLLSLTVTFIFVLSSAVAEVIEPLRPFIGKVTGSLNEVSAKRKEALKDAIDYISDQLVNKKEVKLNFICTHNSRRSHLAQVWTQVAAHHFEISGVKTFSGGTEATACNIRTVRAMRRAGLAIAASNQHKNPIYLVQFSEKVPSMKTFSKIYTEAGNPKEGYIAMMCCADASEKCPVVFGSDTICLLHYEDPKVADNTPGEAAKYDERSLQIAREMFYVMSEVAKK